MLFSYAGTYSLGFSSSLQLSALSPGLFSAPGISSWTDWWNGQLAFFAFQTHQFSYVYDIPACPVTRTCGLNPSQLLKVSRLGKQALLIGQNLAFSSLREPLLACVSLSRCTPEGRDVLPVGEPVSETSGRGLARERKSDFSRETQNVATTGFSMKQNIDKQWEIVKTQANPWESVSSAGSPWHFWSWLMASKSPFIHSCPWDDLLAEG